MPGVPAYYPEQLERWGENQVEVKIHTSGTAKVFIKGQRSANEVVIFTVHDLGCNHTMFHNFINHPKMTEISQRVVWVHVDVPGQEPNAPDLPSDYKFPDMKTLGEDLIAVLDELKIKEVVCFGEGAGANVLARFAMKWPERVLGVVLIHCTGTSAGLMESMQDKFKNWKLGTFGMSNTTSDYLLLHRFGPQRTSETSAEETREAIQKFTDDLHRKINPKNLKMFVDAYLNRSNIAKEIGKLDSPSLIVTGAKASHNTQVHTLHAAMIQQCRQRERIEKVQVHDVANVLIEAPSKVAEGLQYFLQGMGLISSIPMQRNDWKLKGRMRAMSMEEYDMPKLRSGSVSSSPGAGSPPLLGSPLRSTKEEKERSQSPEEQPKVIVAGQN